MSSDAPATLNLGALLRDGLRLTTAEAIAIVYGACAEASTGAARTVPAAPEDVWITDAGQLLITAPADAVERSRSAVAALLETLLPRGGDEPEFDVSDSLRTLPMRLRQAGERAGKDDLHYLLLILSKFLRPNAAGVIEQVARRARERSATVERDEGTTRESIPIDNSSIIVATGPMVDNGVGDLPLQAYRPTPWAPARPVATKDYLPLIAGSVLLMALSGFVGYRVMWNAGEPAPGQTTTNVEPPLPAGEPRIVERDRQPVTEGTPADNANPAPLDLPVANGAFSPSLSGNGTLLFHAGRNASGQLFTTTVDDHGGVTTAEPLINDGARNYHPRLSPDGTRVAFDSDREGERAVYVADRNGTGIRRVSGAGYAAVPSWSPDGSRLAFIKAEPDRARVWNLWLLNVATGELQRHTAFNRGQVWGASWFPDGHRVAYSHEDRLIVSDLQSGAKDVQASPVKGHLVRTPAVSPDGRRIVFQVYGNGVWMCDLATQAVRRVLDDVTAEEFAWDPSGRRIAYHSRRAGKWQIWMMPS